MKVEELINEELERAAELHGEKFNSRHEGYAVLKEEIEELSSAINGLESELEDLWYYIKRDMDTSSNIQLINLEVVANNAIEEAVQVAAMVRKLKNYYEEIK